jgi:hypothetical protein
VRITLTLKIVNRASAVVVLINGQLHAGVTARALPNPAVAGRRL